MDASIRTLEPARLERERRAEPVIEWGAKSPSLDADVGVTDTAVFRHDVIALDEIRRERSRILPPGAPGPAGGPYKMLRTQVLRRLRELNANTLAVLSAADGDGKTLTAINLAIAIAADRDHTALLVDLDLRRPRIHRRFQFEPEVGIEDCLTHGRPLYEAMVKIAGYDRLTVMPARSQVEQSSELLAGQRMGEVMAELRARYFNRILIFDLPPVLMADDALAFSQHVQAGLFVVSEGKTAREGVSRSLTLLHKLPIIGSVLNQSQEQSGGYY
jgi:protein-tyrosine kinase